MVIYRDRHEGYLRRWRLMRFKLMCLYDQGWKSYCDQSCQDTYVLSSCYDDEEKRLAAEEFLWC
jgi:hypothetical protein